MGEAPCNLGFVFAICTNNSFTGTGVICLILLKWGGTTTPPHIDEFCRFYQHVSIIYFFKNLLTFLSFYVMICTSNNEVLNLEKIRNPPTKSKYFCAILYPDSSTYDTDKLIKALAAEHLTFAVSPVHDRDVEDDGSQKKAHYHLLLAYSSATTLNNIRSWFNCCGLPESELHSVRVCASGVGYYRYLTHKDNPEKAQYNDNDIRIFNDSDELFKKFSKTAADKIDDLARIFKIVDELDTISFHSLIQYLMFNERDLFKMLTSSSALAICVKEYQRSLEYDKKLPY